MAHYLAVIRLRRNPDARLKCSFQENGDIEAALKAMCKQVSCYDTSDALEFCLMELLDEPKDSYIIRAEKMPPKDAPPAKEGVIGIKQIGPFTAPSSERIEAVKAALAIPYTPPEPAAERVKHKPKVIKG